MSASKPYPLFTDGVNLYTSFDGGVTLLPVGSGGQDPSNVAITGGSIVGVNTATRSVQGAESPADKACDDDYYGFQKRVHATMLAAVPGLTGFKAYNLVGVNLQSAAIAAATNDAHVEGGGLTAATGLGIWGLGVSVFQNIPGGNWAIAWRGKYVSSATSGAIAFTGISNTAGTDIVVFGVRNSVSTTNWFIRTAKGSTIHDGATSGASDTNTHDFVMTDDGTTVKVFVDTVQVATLTDRSNLTTEAMVPAWLNDTSGNVIVTMCAIGGVW